jgi:hypothetical protein
MLRDRTLIMDGILGIILFFTPILFYGCAAEKPSSPSRSATMVQSITPTWLTSRTSTRLPPSTSTLLPTSTITPQLTATMTSSLRLSIDPALEPIPNGYRLYNSPHWAAFYYPEDWVQVYDESPGDIHFVTHQYTLYSDTILEAIFQVWPYLEGDLVSALEDEIDGLFVELPEAIFLERPHNIEVNGQQATLAILSISSSEGGIGGGTHNRTSNESGSFVILIAMVQVVDRSAEVVAISHGEKQNEYLTVFDFMLHSLYLRGGLPSPVFSEVDDALPEDFTSYADEIMPFGLYHPQDWFSVKNTDYQLYLLPSVRYAEMVTDEAFWESFGEEPIFGSIFVWVIESLSSVWFDDPGETPEELLEWSLGVMGYLNSTYHDGIVVSEYALSNRDGQDMARAYVSGTINGESALGLLTAIRCGDTGLLAIAYDHTLDGLTVPARVMDTLILEEFKVSSTTSSS